MAKRKNKYKANNNTLLMVVIFIVIFGVIYVFFESIINTDTSPLNEVTTAVATTVETTTESDPIFHEVETNITKTNVYINTYWSGGFEFGSATIIDQDDNYYYAITNEHVIDGNDNIINGHRVTTYDEVTSIFEVITSSEELDLALIKFEKLNRDTNITPLTLELNPESNNLVISIGNPYANIGTITYGFIEEYTVINELELHHQVIQHTCTLFRGSSGGALVNEVGHLIGINTWTLKGEYYAIRSSVVQEYISNNL